MGNGVDAEQPEPRLNVGHKGGTGNGAAKLVWEERRVVGPLERLAGPFRLLVEGAGGAGPF